MKKSGYLEKNWHICNPLSLAENSQEIQHDCICRRGTVRILLIAAPLTETGNQLIYTGDDTTDSAGPVSNLLPLPPYVYGQNDMKNADLDAESFKALAKSKSSAFLLFEDATSDIQSKYATVGLQDGVGSRYIARVVSLAKGTRLCKLTQYHMLRDTLSP
jgi:hypothetical protein